MDKLRFGTISYDIEQLYKTKCKVIYV